VAGTGILLLGALLAGCSDATATPALHLDHPTAPGDVVLRISERSADSPEDLDAAPRVLVTGDRRLFVSAPATDRGIVTPVLTRRLTEQEVQDQLWLARDEGLLAPSEDYRPEEPVPDAGSTTVVLDADGGTWKHTARALGELGTDIGPRRRLDDFVTLVERWAADPSGPHLSQVRPQALRVSAHAVPRSSAVDGAAAWPAGARLRPAGVGACTVVRDPAVVRALTTGRQHYYRHGGTTWAVAAAVDLPGDSCVTGPRS